MTTADRSSRLKGLGTVLLGSLLFVVLVTALNWIAKSLFARAVASGIRPRVTVELTAAMIAEVGILLLVVLLLRRRRRCASLINPHAGDQIRYTNPVLYKMRLGDVAGHDHELPDVDRPPSPELPKDARHAVVILDVAFHLRTWHRNERRSIEPFFADRLAEHPTTGEDGGFFVAPLRPATALHRLSKIVDQAVRFAEREPPSCRVFAEVEALVLQLEERVVRPGEVINLGETLGQGALECLRTPARAPHLALQTSRAT